ncbi:hypothetical protein Y032_0047g1535 [Ancylostoma ceylanicum]|uniref:Mos1 transposase HTH domain-containing protein n=1 Tax=Ancylostoma ceylanicum TaxID=53326 RepID=A0A016UCK1_9BILA|nr:hypothetical protein Y032_0047g1535 [Ancylostoma ceylanicum]
MLYDFKQGKTAAESHRSLCEAFGKDVISESQCRRWFQRFRSGDEDLEDEPLARGRSVIDDEVLREVVESDPKQTTRELAVRFECSHMTIKNHLNAIGKSSRCGKWVPHQLTADNLGARIAISQILLRCSKSCGFFENILTSDEKWVMFDNTIKKPQWLSKGEQPSPTPKPDIHGKKVMLCVWWNMKGLLYMEVLNSDQTVTADLYAQQLGRVDQALRRQGVEPTEVKFLHDNARPHVAKITQQKIEELGWELLPHPPYSPDLAPSDYHLFRSMQHSLAEKKFNNREEITLWLSSYFDMQPSQFFENGIRFLRRRWRRVIDNNGEFILD